MQTEEARVMLSSPDRIVEAEACVGFEMIVQKREKREGKAIYLVVT